MQVQVDFREFHVLLLLWTMPILHSYRINIAVSRVCVKGVGQQVLKNTDFLLQGMKNAETKIDNRAK